MKVLIVGNLPLDTTQITGGVQSVIINLLEGFIENKIKVYVFSLNSELIKRERIEYSENIVIDYFPFGKIKSTKIENLFHGRKLLKKYIDEIKPDIIHFQGNGSNLLLAIGLRKDNLVVTPHAILREEYKHQATFRAKINHRLVIDRKSVV